MNQQTDINYKKLRETTETSKEHCRKADTLFLYFTVCTVTISWLVGATTTVWTSPALVKMKSNDTRINPIGRPITVIETSMLIGIPGCMSLLGCSLLPKLADLMGRKSSIVIITLGLCVSMIGLAFSNTIELIICYYTATIVSFSGLMVVLPIYLMEICEDHNRARFGCLITICFPIGQLYAYCIGPFFSLRDYTLLSTVLIIPFLILAVFIPETPIYSLKNGKEDECRRTLKKLRNNKSAKELEVDFERMRGGVNENNREMGIRELFSTKEGRLSIFLGSLPILTQYLCGMAIMLPLMAPILDESGSCISGNYIAIVSAVFKFFAFTITFLIVERTGRRPLLILSAIGSGVSIAALGIFFYLKSIDSPLIDSFRWFPLVCVIFFVTSYSLGLGPIPIGMVSILFPVEVRSTASAVIVTSTYVIMTLYGVGYPILSEAVGTHWCMAAFAVTSFIGAFLMYAKLPETQGKSLEEIQEILKEY